MYFRQHEDFSQIAFLLQGYEIVHYVSIVTQMPYATLNHLL